MNQVTFPGYDYNMGKSTYRGEVVGEGGYVYAEPGMYENVVLLDVASQHPNSIIQLNLFGDEYTKKYKDLLDARIAIKNKNYTAAKKMLDGKLEPYLNDPADAKALSDALKLALNTVYGLTSAKFDNPFRDVRNKDNIVAKRGALFMLDLKHYVQNELGAQVVHIKTDSIKIPNATDVQIKAIMEFGQKYGYTFEHEETYKRMCLVNDAVYIAKKSDGSWYAVGAQFQHPVVFKTLFSGEEIEFKDYGEAKSVQKGAMYLDFQHDKPEPTPDRMRFVGRTGLFVPVNETETGGVLYRINEGKLYAVTGTKGFLWAELDMAKMNESVLDMRYYQKLIDAAQQTIGKYGDFDGFVS